VFRTTFVVALACTLFCAAGCAEVPPAPPAGMPTAAGAPAGAASAAVSPLGTAACAGASGAAACLTNPPTSPAGANAAYLSALGSPAPAASAPSITATQALSSTPTPAPAMSPVTLTQVITYTPPAPAGQAQSGYCWTSSISIARPGAWRCMIGNSIMDPCFSLPGASGAVECGADPLKGEPGFRLNLTQPLPGPFPTPSASYQRAWLLLLSDGVGCVFLTGATGAVHNDRINYQCSDSKPDGNQYDDVIGELSPGKVQRADRATVRIAADGSIQVEKETTIAVRALWR